MPYITRSAKKCSNISEVSAERKNEYIGFGMYSKCDKEQVNKCVAENKIFRNGIITRFLEIFPNPNKHNETVGRRNREEIHKSAEASVAALRRSPRKNIKRINYSGME